MKNMTLKEIKDRKELLRLQKVYVDVKMIVEELEEKQEIDRDIDSKVMF